MCKSFVFVFTMAQTERNVMFEVLCKASRYNAADKAEIHTFATKAEAEEFATEFGGKARAIKLTPTEAKRAALLASFGQKYTPARGV
jgi:hypothetical protein